MSKWLELLKILPRAIANIDKVAEGYYNDIKLEYGDMVEEEKDEIIRRRLICDACPYLSTNAIQDGWYTTDRVNEHCTLCGCPKNTKTASLTSNCGAEVYNQQNPDKPKIDLKWEAFIK